MLTGTLPEWPYDWPPQGHQRLRRLHPALVELVRRAISLDPRKRFQDAGQMLSALQRIKARALRSGATSGRKSGTSKSKDWRAVQRLQFLRSYGNQLEAKHNCSKCEGPVAEAMQFCPWCGEARRVHSGSIALPQQCPRCHRGLKTDWRFCAWCYGTGFEVTSTRQYPDRRYTGKCTNRACTRKLLMPFMRYCPWCRRKVSRRWQIEGSEDKCRSCGWGVINAFWSYCPWCGKTLTATRKR
jgi:hypothetical protein